ncbi:MAG: hypothetical protein M3167_13700 [Acidobacteriota bacterium]|nr:hypothetical protein [Acidobacteriota bacterium]
MTPRIATAAARVYALPPTSLPVPAEPGPVQLGAETLVRQLAGLGYPRYAHVRSRARANPASVVLGAVSQDEVDARVTQALPWVLARYPHVHWDWLLRQAKVRNAQNRLGFVVSLARELAESRRDGEAVDRLATAERELEDARLLAEKTLGHESMPESERTWLRANRSALARHWNVLSTLTLDQVRDAG